MRKITADKSKVKYYNLLTVVCEKNGRKQKLYFDNVDEKQADEIISELENDFRATLNKYRPEVDFN